MTALKGASVFVTGGSRGIGKALVEELYVRCAGKVYATARDPRSVTHPDALPVALEVTELPWRRQPHRRTLSPY
jgi:NAD(P)-dependent dehydrogenase (short-subunit alcohol dehydrogenase family)